LKEKKPRPKADRLAFLNEIPEFRLESLNTKITTSSRGKFRAAHEKEKGGASRSGKRKEPDRKPSTVKEKRARIRRWGGNDKT